MMMMVVVMMMMMMMMMMMQNSLVASNTYIYIHMFTVRGERPKEEGRKREKDKGGKTRRRKNKT
jgi:hypothetical protein